MKTLLTDEEMIRQCLPSQPNQCFEALYNRYVKKVYQRCLSMTKDSEKAQDFTHDIFLKAFDKLGNFRQQSSFSTWLYSIAYNYCADQLRLSRRYSMTSLDANLELISDDSVEDQLHEEALQLVQQTINTLSAQERSLLRMKYDQGMSIDEIARAKQLKDSTVKMRLKRCRAKIKTLCERQLLD